MQNGWKMSRRLVNRNIKVIRITGSKSFGVISSDHPYWKTGSLNKIKRDSFIKILPPSNATDDEISNIKIFLEENGVEIVKIMPREFGDKVVSESSIKISNQTMRETVIDFAKNMKNSFNRSELINVLNETMDQVEI